MHRKTLAALVFIAGAILWTIAKELTDNRLGAIPTVIIVGPFMYGAMRLWRTPSPLYRSVTAEPESDPNARSEEASTEARPLEAERGPASSPTSSNQASKAERNAGARDLLLACASLIAIMAIGLWWGGGQGDVAGAVAEGTSAETLTAFDEGSRTASTYNTSAFVQLALDGVSISVPRDWRTIGENDARSLNTASEAVTGIGQGNNTILWAANAFDDANVTRATMRISVRDAATVSQGDLREALKQPQQSIELELRNAAEQGAASVRKLPQAIYYSVTGAGLRDNGQIVCMWSGYEYDIGKGPTISDLWICPSSTRTFKFATSYAKARAPLYAPTVNQSWRSLSFNP